jgi:hypothetical protein
MFSPWCHNEIKGQLVSSEELPTITLQEGVEGEGPTTTTTPTPAAAAATTTMLMMMMMMIIMIIIIITIIKNI